MSVRLACEKCDGGNIIDDYDWINRLPEKKCLDCGSRRVREVPAGLAIVHSRGGDAANPIGGPIEPNKEREVGEMVHNGNTGSELRILPSEAIVSRFDGRIEEIVRMTGKTARSLFAGSQGISNSVVHEVKKRARPIGVAKWGRIAAILGVRPEWLLYGTEPQEAQAGLKADEGISGAGKVTSETRLPPPEGTSRRHQRRLAAMAAKPAGLAPSAALADIAELRARLNGNVILVDFGKHQELREFLDRLAEEDFRTPEAEILYLISRRRGV